MAFWRKLLGRSLAGADSRVSGLQSGLPNYASNPAVPVTVDTALQLSAVWACTRLIAETIGSLPIYVYRRDNETGEYVKDYDHPLSRLFSGKVNRWQTRQEYFETVTYQLAMMGNNYSAIQRNSRGEIVSLLPLMSSQMEVTLEDNGSVLYRYQSGQDVKIYAPQTIWHNKLFGNGIIGLSPLGYARNSIGIGQAVETSVTKIYASGGKPSGVLTVDDVLKPEQRERIRQNFSEMSQGDNSRLFVLEAGFKYTQISLSPQDIELLASRRFQIEDIARFFGVPSVLINDTTAATTWGSGIQQIVEGWYKLGLRPYLKRYQDSMTAWLLTPEERLNYEILFDLDELLQPSLAERLRTYKEAVTGGIMMPNEARKEEGWKPQEGGDNLFMQQQMVPIKKLENPLEVQNG